MISKTNRWIALIEKYGNKVPSIQDLIKEYKYKHSEEQFAFNYFWNNYSNNIKIIPIDEDILIWTGLKTIDKFIEILENNDINYKSYNYEEYIDFLNNNPNIYIPVPKKIEYNKIFRFIKTNDFQDIISIFDTDLSRKMRRYDLCYDNLFKFHEEMTIFYNEKYIKNN